MNEITIICSVAIDFKGPDGQKFRIKAEDRFGVMRAPAWIMDTNEFKWASQDGSLKFVTPANKVQAENEPTLGLTAEGKAVKEPAETEAPRRSRKKAEPTE